MSFIKQLGYLAIGTRFRVLTDRLMQDADKIYMSLDLEFEPRWFAVFYLINKNSPVTITEITEELGYSQPAVTQIANSLIKKKLIRAVKSKNDSRKKFITITEKGKALIEKLNPVWEDIEIAVKELLDSTDYDILFIISKLESALDSKDIYSRVMEKIKLRQIGNVKIIDYKPRYKKLFRDLNYEWLNKYFTIENKDRDLLENPDKEILKKGGYIFFAECDNKINGTVALIKHSDKEFELAKMAVTEDAQGKQIGKKLAIEAINQVISLNAEKLFLETNSSLIPALNLYKSLGFNEVEMKKGSEYKRATLRMELNLKTYQHNH
ncbi:MAG TPA: bifunctional helix-turn-helix transcriptional regulator/GNAT family N-acetyltransferase [Ignavibacteria bacterium]|nr:bifunctional helix-turn-helix transcriptional regulator/GNAT family N-acetyltransferase [Ignavibacteria bacterium]HMR40349.1 bifunctional helix-turn-helix transcriptional regulator/GNAT family N-acetyltransferase [Ignavibacteria bacterium]